MEPRSPALQVDSLPTELPGKPKNTGVVAYPFSRDPPNPGIKLGSPALQADSLPAELPGKPMTNLDNVLKSRDITLLTKVCIVQAMVFPVVMYRCESWTTKKAEC